MTINRIADQVRRLPLLFRRRDLWAVGVFRVRDIREIFEAGRGELLRYVGQTGLRLGRGYQSTVADPFLLGSDGKLFLFYEVKTDHGHGEIWAESMTPEGNWKVHGCVLKERFHVSYPQVFMKDGGIFMVPETAQSGAIWLYEAEGFPFGWKRRRVLVNAPLRDPTILFGDKGIFLFATTENYELKVFHSSRFDDKFDEIKVVGRRTRSTARGAGGMLVVDGELLRPSQDCSGEYGKRINFQIVEELSEREYRETSSELSVECCGEKWMAEGHHHISCASVNGATFVAIDGKRKDWVINSVLLGVLRGLDG